LEGSAALLLVAGGPLAGAAGVGAVGLAVRTTEAAGRMSVGAAVAAVTGAADGEGGTATVVPEGREST
jgi:hypothetical protein